MFGAIEIARRLGPGKRVATIIPDSAERYLSKEIFHFNEKDRESFISPRRHGEERMHLMRCFTLVVLICILSLQLAVGQQETKTLPTVTNFECPKYPAKAKSMRLQGLVLMQVTTDGHRVTDVKVTSGHPVLADDAAKNARTWEFAQHSAMTFPVTYLYVNQGEFKQDPTTQCSAKMELPAKVTVSTRF